ncbi:MAG: cobalamin-binding protein [Gammaproteobacteria bacterium]|nr:cobalamin-binding protein [Gammaproteobacteria bacterium]MBU1647686.1 cobalamin-binding protein [Gammaproteobacteria bacterium]MBU1971832.1 cobalamin-binding protein [Gammaproteobacteria bacterium]
MRRLLALLLLCWLGIARAEVVVGDDAGESVRLPQAARRIISLSPHITELLFAAGAGERVIAAVEYSDFPVAAKNLPRVGSYSALDLERIARLRPDLAIAWGSGNPPAQVAQLARLGIPVFVSEPKRLEDIPATLRRLGRLAGTAAAAEAAAGSFERRLGDLRTRHSGARPVSVFYEIWNQPLMTVGGDHVISAAISLCGGRNVFAALTQPAEAVALEAVLRADPEAIIASGMGEQRPDWLDHWRRWPRLQAVKRDNLYFVPPDLLQRHTPRLLDGAERLCAALEVARGRAVQPGK